MPLGKIIREKREELHMTQEDLADRMGVSRQAVSKWESGLSIPAQGNLQELCDILGFALPEETAGEGAPRKHPSKALWIFGITGWAVACILAVLFPVRAWQRMERAAEKRITDVSFYDNAGRKIEREANWYGLAPFTTVVVTYQGETPDAAAVYLTPSGTETLSERRQLVVVPLDDDNKGYVLIQLTLEEYVMGHLQVVLTFGSVSISSDDYNVLCN